MRSQRRSEERLIRSPHSRSAAALSLALALSLPASVASATGIDTLIAGPVFAVTKLGIEGIDLGVNGMNTIGGVIQNRPWTFMFADGTYAFQQFSSDVGPPGGFAGPTALSTRRGVQQQY